MYIKQNLSCEGMGSPRLLKSLDIAGSPRPSCKSESVAQMLGIGRKVSQLQRFSVSTRDSLSSCVGLDPMFLPSPLKGGSELLVNDVIQHVFGDTLPLHHPIGPSSEAPDVEPPVEDDVEETQAVEPAALVSIVTRRRHENSLERVVPHPVGCCFVPRWFLQTRVRLRWKLWVALTPLLLNVVYLIVLVCRVFAVLLTTEHND